MVLELVGALFHRFLHLRRPRAPLEFLNYIHPDLLIWVLDKLEGYLPLNTIPQDRVCIKT